MIMNSSRLQKSSFFLLPLFLSFFLLLSNSARSQTPADELKKSQQRFPNDYYLYTKRDKIYQMSIVNNALKITAQTEEELLLLKDLASRSTEETIEYSPLFQVSDIEAYSLVPTENKYKKVATTDIKDRHKFSSSIFHDDINEKVFDYQQLEIGAKRYLKYTTTYQDPKMLNGYFFGYNVATDHILFQVECDNAIDLGYKEFNTNGYHVQLKIDKQKSKTIYTWTCDTMAKIDLYDNSPSFRSSIPHIEVFIKKYTIDGKEYKMLENVNDLHSYYAGFLKDLNKETSPALKNITDSLIKGKTTEIDRVKAIYYWVKSTIKYVAFEDGYGGYIPRQASDVCDKKYGDCKDMASITHAMLQYAGIKNSYITWIGTRDIPYAYDDLPTGAVDNHMIVTYKTADSTYFLDATSEHTPFGYPTEFIQGKEAMLHIDASHFEIIRVPEMPANKNVYADSIFIEVRNDTLLGKGYATLTGYMRNYYLDIMYDLEGEQKMKSVKSYLQKGNNKFYLQNFQEINKTDRDQPLQINFSFLLNSYVINSNNDQFLNLFLEKTMLSNKIDADRKADIEYDYKNIYTYTVAFKVPAGYSAKYIPQPSLLDNKLYRFSSAFEQSGDMIILRYSCEIKTLLLQQKDFSMYNDFVAFLKKQYAENISITKKN